MGALLYICCVFRVCPSMLPLIIGIACGLSLALVLIALLALFIFFRRRKHNLGKFPLQLD